MHTERQVIKSRAGVENGEMILDSEHLEVQGERVQAVRKEFKFAVKA